MCDSYDERLFLHIEIVGILAQSPFQSSLLNGNIVIHYVSRAQHLKCIKCLKVETKNLHAF